MTAEVAAALERCRAHLQAQRLYPRPLSLRRVRLVTAPWLFALPWFRRFDGYTMWDLILLRRPLDELSLELVCHELCHVWQMQHRPVRMPLSYLFKGYANNPYEIEARAAAASVGSWPAQASTGSRG